MSGSSGMSSCTTQSTMGKSSPLAAMLVHSSTPCFFSQKVKQIAILFFCFWWPCSQYRGVPSLNFRNDSQRNLTCLQVDTKTMIFCLEWVLRKEQKVLILSSGGTTMQYCISLAGVQQADPATVLLGVAACRELTPWRRIFSGSSVQMEARAQMSLVMVAENMRVWQRGRLCMIIRSDSLKPISIMTSASSSTSICRLLVQKPQVPSRCCSKRPGVATSTFMRCSWSFSCRMSLPPITSPTLISSFSLKEFSTSNTWMASYRTGTITRAPSPSTGMNLLRQSFSTRGTRQARVLPEPVREETSTSRPAMAWGMEQRCTSVILENPRPLSPLRVPADTGRSLKLTLNLAWKASSSPMASSCLASSSLQSQKYSPLAGAYAAMRYQSCQTSAKRTGLGPLRCFLIVDGSNRVNFIL